MLKYPTLIFTDFLLIISQGRGEDAGLFPTSDLNAVVKTVDNYVVKKDNGVDCIQLGKYFLKW